MNEVCKKIFAFLKEKGIIIVSIISILLICYVHSVRASYSVDFIPINGTFQNFNVVRRLLDGQVPFKDFSIYLGLGHLFLGSFFTSFFGGSFSSSLVAFSFLAKLALCALSLIVGKCVLGKDSRVPYTITTVVLIVTILLEDAELYEVPIIKDFIVSLTAGLSTGNSARFLRGMILPLVIGLTYFASWLIDVLAKKKEWKNKTVDNLKLIIASVIAGVSFLWSNDYGIACFVCYVIMLLVLTFFRTRSLSRTAITFAKSMSISVLAVFVVVFIITRGNVGSWLLNMLGTGGTQAWYYGVRKVEKSFYLYDINFDFLASLVGIMCLYYFFELLKSSLKGDGKIDYRSSILCYMTMTSYAAINEYKLLSGGSLTEVAYSVLFFILIYEVLGWLIKISKTKKWESFLLVGGSIFGFGFLVYGVYDTCNLFKIHDKCAYVDELGGYLYKYRNSLKDAQELLGEEKVFSTYASALETVTSQFQPSGIDYIIHALGDQKRDAYMDTFRKGDFRYVTTIRECVSDYAYWIKNANWFFYRELYDNYVPVYSNEYEIFWEKSDEVGKIENDDIDVKIEKIDESNAIIKVKTDESVSGIADVKLRYAIRRTDNLSAKLVMNKFLFLDDVNEHYLQTYMDFSRWFLPSESEEYVPITIIDGEGELLLSSLPSKDTVLEVESVSCDTIYTTYFDFAQLEKNFHVDQKEGAVTVLVENEKRIRYVLEGAEKAIIGSKQFKILNINSNQDMYTITLDYEGKDDFADVLDGTNILFVKN